MYGEIRSLVLNILMVGIKMVYSLWKNVLWFLKKLNRVITEPSILLFIYTPNKKEKEMATHTSTPAWKIPWMEESDRL